jgi:hypothetical protein
MAAGQNWSPQEVRATVVDYMAMLRFELAGQTYNKTSHRNTLLKQLDGRSDSAVELKHQNISAVLQDLGYFWIPGYKPRSNYQAMLASEVESWVRTNPDLDQHAAAAAEAPAATPALFDFESFEVARSSMRSGRTPGMRESRGTYSGPAVPRIRDYAAREAHNSSLGRAGEELVVRYEQHRLSVLGLDRFAARVEHVSKTQGDGLGFDVLSFDRRGGERFIEVKTTTFAKETPFFATSSEVGFARKNAERYSVYRLFDFRREPKCYSLPGLIEDHCALDPVSFRCSFR